MTSTLFPDTSKLVLTAGQVLFGDVDEWMSAMADELGVRPGTISDWANGRRSPTHAHVERLNHLVLERANLAVSTAERLNAALPRMLCPVCQKPLTVLHAPGQRSLRCEGVHTFKEKDGPPYGPFTEKEFLLVDQETLGEGEAVLWIALIDEKDFPEFERKVRGLFGPWVNYLQGLKRRVERWNTDPKHKIKTARVTVADLDRYIAMHGGCSTQELTALAKAKIDGFLT